MKSAWIVVIVCSAIVAIIAAIGCAPGLECGPGTVEQEGICVATAPAVNQAGSAGATATGGSAGASGAAGASAGGSAGSKAGAGGSSGGGAGAAGTSAGGTSGSAGAVSDAGGSAGSGGASSDGCVPSSGYIVTVTVSLAGNQLPAQFRHDFPGKGWEENAVNVTSSPAEVKAAATAGLHRLNAILPGQWLVRGDQPGGMLSVPESDLRVRVNCSDLPGIAKLAAGQTKIPAFTAWYGKESVSGYGNVFLCVSSADCVIDAR